jgi:hypothetical protein
MAEAQRRKNLVDKHVFHCDRDTTHDYLFGVPAKLQSQWFNDRLLE